MRVTHAKTLQILEAHGQDYFDWYEDKGRQSSYDYDELLFWFQSHNLNAHLGGHSRRKEEKEMDNHPGLTVRRFVDVDGNTPNGSTGWVHLHSVAPGNSNYCEVSSAGHIARIWAAQWKPESDCYLQKSPGRQWKAGVVIETFC